MPGVKELITNVECNQAILFHGHWQTSALRHIQSLAYEAGIMVYYLDLMSMKNDLKTCYDFGKSIYDFLASKIKHHSEIISDFTLLTEFCSWIEDKHKDDIKPPILLIDEF